MRKEITRLAREMNREHRNLLYGRSEIEGAGRGFSDPCYRPGGSRTRNEFRRLMSEGHSRRETAHWLRAGYGTVYRKAQRLQPDPVLVQKPVASLSDWHGGEESAYPPRPSSHVPLLRCDTRYCEVTPQIGHTHQLRRTRSCV